jgi:hypothetical protein
MCGEVNPIPTIGFSLYFGVEAVVISMLRNLQIWVRALSVRAVITTFDPLSFHLLLPRKMDSNSQAPMPNCHQVVPLEY